MSTIPGSEPSKECGVCYGVLYLTRNMIRQKRGPKCFGYLSTTDPTFIPREEDDEIPEHLSTLLIVGKASVLSDNQIGGVSGLRFIVISTQDDDIAQDVIDVDWKKAFEKQLDRQKQIAGVLGERMVWQLSPSGLKSLKEQFAAFAPAASEFAQNHLRRMRSFFTGEPPRSSN